MIGFNYKNSYKCKLSLQCNNDSQIEVHPTSCVNTGAGHLFKSEHNYTSNFVALSHHNLPAHKCRRSPCLDTNAND